MMIYKVETSGEHVTSGLATTTSAAEATAWAMNDLNLGYEVRVWWESADNWGIVDISELREYWEN